MLEFTFDSIVLRLLWTFYIIATMITPFSPIIYTEYFAKTQKIP